MAKTDQDRKRERVADGQGAGERAAAENVQENGAMARPGGAGGGQTSATGGQGGTGSRQTGTAGSQSGTGGGPGSAAGGQGEDGASGARKAAEARPVAPRAVGGFWFTDEDVAKQAEREAEGIVYIRQKVDMDEPLMVLQVYNKMVEQKLFETAVGFSYLKELWDYLYSIPFIRKEEILAIPTEQPTLEAGLRQRARRIYGGRGQGAGQRQVTNIDYKVRFRVMLGVSAVLVVIIAAMFAITATSGNATILNYEQQLIDRYSEWEQELSEREAAVVEREKELGLDE